MYKTISICLIVLVTLTSVSGKTIQAEFAQVDRIVVVGDVHGDMDQLIAVLQSADLIDKKRRWIGEETHMVQIGDIPGRGPDTREIIEYLKRLKKEAIRAGGHIHTLIGNHDAMNMLGDLRYVHPGEYAAFRTRESKAKLDILYEDTVDQIKDSQPRTSWPDFGRAHKREWLEDKPLGYVEHRLHWLPDGPFGEWVRANPTLLKIGDTLFVHAGITLKDVGLSIEEINTGVHQILTNTDISPDSLARREDGPLWYRGLALHNEKEEAELVEKILERFEVNRIIIGHTPTPGVIVPRFDGKVILTDVGLSAHYGSNLACLEISDGKTYAIHRGQRMELPEANNEDFLKYLDAVVALEKDKRKIQLWMDRLKKAQAK